MSLLLLVHSDMAAGGRFNFADMQNPLFLHPSDGPLSISVTKLQGAGDYRGWKRSFEIQISSKRKLGFLNGTVTRSTTDETQGLQWDTCNDLVIAWIHGNVSDNIKRSILFINSAHEIWKQLEKRFQLSNGSRKYKLTKELFTISQGKFKIHEYYTVVSSLWEEIDSMNVLPSVTTVADDITTLLKAIDVQKEESRLFVFLNGLDDAYSALRSQLLMQQPLPTVEAVCAMLQQEESQRDVLPIVDIEHTAMYSKGPTERNVEKNALYCSACGGKNHTSDRCWVVNGFPKWHYKNRKPVPRGGGHNQGPTRWIGNNRQSNQRMANNVSAANETNKDDVMFSPQQLQQLLKLMPGNSGNTQRGSDTEEELEMGFSGMVACNLSIVSHNAWIIDSGASDHMTCSVAKLSNVTIADSNLTITLPTGDVSKITHMGDMRLDNGLVLYKVLVVPQFNHNLLSIHKLAHDNNCDVKFTPDTCEIISSQTNAVQAVGRVYNGLYYLFDNADGGASNTQPGILSQCSAAAVDINLWHLRLGHASTTKMRHIPMLKQHVRHTGQVTDHLVHNKFNCFLTSYTSNTDPSTFAQALKHHHWVDAMNKELSALELNNTWEVTELPPSKKSIGCKWVFKTKFNTDGTVERYKARLVILGCKQTYGVDYMDTFAPVAKLTTVRTLLAMAAIQDWIVIQMDVTNAFLHGDLQEIVYMKFPPGYKGMGSRISYSHDAGSSSSAKGLVCRLIKSLYGLKQAPRTWFSKLSLTLINNDYVQSKTDYSLFVKTTKETIVLVLVYVDDFLIAGNSSHDIAALKKMLFVNFHMKDLGDVRYFLGLEIDRKAEGFFVSQKKYTLDLLKEYDMEDASPVKLPMDVHIKLAPAVGTSLSDPHPYQRLLGKLIYLTVTRPDITFSVQQLSQYMQHPTSEHMKAATRVLRYLLTNPSQGVLLASSSAAHLHAYCDSDWASCPVTRRSTSGFCVLLGNSPISWKSKKQTVVARSTAEAEYRAMALTSCEITWITALLKDMGLQHIPPTILQCDNKAAIAIAANPVLHERTKHIEVDCHFVRDKIKSGAIVTKHVPSHSQVADILTKPVSIKQHYGLLRKLGATSPAAQLEGE